MILLKVIKKQLIISLRNGEEIRSIEVYNAAMQRIDTKESQGKEVIWEKGYLAKGIYTVIIQTKNIRSGVYRFAQVD